MRRQCNPEIGLPRLEQGELSPNRKRVEFAREISREERRQPQRGRCVHYHTHYHAHYDPDPYARQAAGKGTKDVWSKAIRASTSWWHWTVHPLRSRQGCSSQGPSHLHTFWAATSSRDVAEQIDHALTDVLQNDPAKQHSHGKRHRGEERRHKRNVAEERQVHQRQNQPGDQLYPWLHPYLRAGKVHRSRQIAYR